VSTSPVHHAFVLLPRHSPLALGAAMELLGAANALLEQPLHRWTLLGPDARPVAAAGAVGASGSFPQPGAPGDAPPFAAVWLFTDPLQGERIDAHEPEVLHEWLQQRAREGCLLAGVGSGAAVLARAGLLDGHRATAHWQQLPELAAAHPRVVFSALVYESDRRRLSCGAGTAVLDMMIGWLGQQHGARLQQQLVDHAGIERLRGRDERQRVPLALRMGGSAKLGEALALMEANLGEPLPTEDIARLVGVSRRQLERLFKQHLGELPSRHYGELRLARAQRLLRSTSMSVLQVGLACGFSSGSHFSNAYRARFGRTPREERNPLLHAAAASEDLEP
jgi:transcriptional regulator GlxA family with amidase domain